MTLTRRRVRIIVVSLATLILIGTLVVAVKLVSLSAIAGLSISRYEVGAFERSAESSDALIENNYFEPWIAYFDRGTAIAAQGLFNDSIGDLERAFELAPQDRRCDVARNLSLSWESLGDQYVQQNQFAGATKLYALAQAALEAAGDGCGGTTPTDSDDGTPSDADGSARQRLDAKAKQAQQLDQAAKDQAQQGTPDPLGDLKKQGDAAQQEKSDRSAERDAGPLGPAPGDRPW